MSQPLRILAIGNSFSVDAMQYLAQIANELGTPVVLGNLYIPGCPLQRHYDNTLIGAHDYTYYKTTDGVWTATPEATIDTGLDDEDWDIVTMQQSSPYSGAPETYTCLPLLIDTVRRRLPRARLVWHMTWAYQGNSTHKHFPRYHRNQDEMYRAILDRIADTVLPTGAFDTVIPTGTAVQNARTGFIGDTLTRDGYHLSYTVGRLLAGMTWYAALTGRPLDALTFNPAPDEITPALLALLKESAAAALAAPDRVTLSRLQEQGYISEHLEIERKWLIVRPDPVLLAARPGAEAIRITQTYLLAGEGESSRRVRAAVHMPDTPDARTIYTHTVKRRLSHTVAEEEEREIDRDAYLALLADADPACTPIEKTRWRIPYEGRILEIDIYPFWEKQAVLEIELPSPDTPVSLPDWLTVLCEVSDDRRYSNHNLARGVRPAE